MLILLHVRDMHQDPDGAVTRLRNAEAHIKQCNVSLIIVAPHFYLSRDTPQPCPPMHTSILHCQVRKRALRARPFRSRTSVPACLLRCKGGALTETGVLTGGIPCGQRSPALRTGARRCQRKGAGCYDAQAALAATRVSAALSVPTPGAGGAHASALAPDLSSPAEMLLGGSLSSAKCQPATSLSGSLRMCSISRWPEMSLQRPSEESAGWRQHGLQAVPWLNKEAKAGLMLRGVLQQSCDASMPDEAAAWSQDDLYQMVPWLIKGLADEENSHLALAGGLKAAAMQLLPPLLDGLHARILGLLERERCADELRLRLLFQPFSDTLVSPGAAVSRRCPCKVWWCAFVLRSITRRVSMHGFV